MCEWKAVPFTRSMERFSRSFYSRYTVLVWLKEGTGMERLFLGEKKKHDTLRTYQVLLFIQNLILKKGKERRLTPTVVFRWLKCMCDGMCIK